MTVFVDGMKNSAHLFVMSGSSHSVEEAAEESREAGEEATGSRQAAVSTQFLCEFYLSHFCLLSL